MPLDTETLQPLAESWTRINITDWVPLDGRGFRSSGYEDLRVGAPAPCLKRYFVLTLVPQCATRGRFGRRAPPASAYTAAPTASTDPCSSLGTVRHIAHHIAS